MNGEVMKIFRNCAIPLLPILLLAGCSSPPTGRMRDAHLLSTGKPAERRIAEVKEFGPLREEVTTASGATRVSYRPFLYTNIFDPAADAERTEILWPFFEANRRNDAYSWRFMLFFGGNRGERNLAADGREMYHTWIFPFLYYGRTRQGEDYAALWPVYGTVRDIWWDRIHFAAFPLWLEYERAGYHTWCVLWPIFSRTTGEYGHGWTAFPFYGRMNRYKTGEYSRFIFWPFWSDGKYTKRNPGYSWMLFPLAGRIKRADQSSYMFLPPFFNFTNGRGGRKEYRNYACPWPFVRILDDDEWSQRYFWPFYGTRWSTDGSSASTTVLWPFYNTAYDKSRTQFHTRTSLFPVYYHTKLLERKPSDPEDEYALTEDFMRIWPLYSNRRDPTNSFTRIPDFGFSKREGALERNFLGALTLYTRGETQSPRQVSHSLLWGMFQRRYGEEEHGTRVWPFWSSSETEEKWRWSVLGGFIGREKPEPEKPARWRFLWIF